MGEEEVPRSSDRDRAASNDNSIQAVRSGPLDMRLSHAAILLNAFALQRYSCRHPFLPAEDAILVPNHAGFMMVRIYGSKAWSLLKYFGASFLESLPLSEFPDLEANVLRIRSTLPDNISGVVAEYYRNSWSIDGRRRPFELQVIPSRHFFDFPIGAA